MTTSVRSSGFATPSSLVERLWQDFCIATGFLTVLPLLPRAAESAGSEATSDAGAPQSPQSPFPAIARAAGLFPLIGVGIGTVAALALLASFHIGLHPLACAMMALAVAACITGALHEDGLADFFDGLGGGRTPQQRLAIMQDSRLGSFGALALIFTTVIRAATLSGLFSPDTAALALIAAASVSRAVLPGLMRWLDPAKPGGLGATAGKPEATQIALAILIALVTALLSVGFWGAMSALAAAAVTASIVGFLAQRKLGGQTGDVLGAAQVIVELAVLAAIAATDQ